MSVGCEEPGIWGKFQSAAGEKLQNSVRAREILRNNMVRLTLAARRLVLVIAKNSVYASYTSPAPFLYFFYGQDFSNGLIVRWFAVVEQCLDRYYMS